MESTGGSIRADHLCVLVHGLWGNPGHMKNVAKTLRARYSEDELYIHIAKRNSGGFTYDGVELGGERVCDEIIEELGAIEAQGGRITKLSVVGYSMGGLIARYAVGLLYAKGALDSLTCMNFATFASPHLGSHSPYQGWFHYLWNVFGARTISVSGQQLFIVDDFRNAGRPLLAVMADPDSIFMNGLRMFRRHTLYSNITNDGTTRYFTTCIEKTDPYDDLEQVEPKFVDGYEGLVLDVSSSRAPESDPIEMSSPGTEISSSSSSSSTSSSSSLPSSSSSALAAAWSWIKSVPTIVAITILLPIATVAFLLMTVFQTVRSSRRVRLHRERAAFNVHEYRIPFLIKDLKGGVEHAIEVLHGAKKQSRPHSRPGSDRHDELAGLLAHNKAMMATGTTTTTTGSMARKRRPSVEGIPGGPRLALTSSQLEMARSLNEIQWRKYPVWIRSNRHAHAVIVVRADWKSFSDGWLVLKHFAHGEFLL